MILHGMHPPYLVGFNECVTIMEGTKVKKKKTYNCIDSITIHTHNILNTLLLVQNVSIHQISHMIHIYWRKYEINIILYFSIIIINKYQNFQNKFLNPSNKFLISLYISINKMLELDT